MELFSNPKYLLFNRITGNRRYFEETTSLKPPCTCMLDLNLLSLLVLLQTVSRVQNHQELCKRRKYIAKTVQKITSKLYYKKWKWIFPLISNEQLASKYMYIKMFYGIDREACLQILQLLINLPRV